MLNFRFALQSYKNITNAQSSACVKAPDNIFCQGP